MAINLGLYEYSDEDEDYIEIDITSLPSNPPHVSPRIQEFEFQMPFTSHIKQHPFISTADELFQDGKILPLHRRNIVPRHDTAAVDIAMQALQEDGYDFGQGSSTICIKKSLDRVDPILYKAKKVDQKRPWTKKIKLIEKIFYKKSAGTDHESSANAKTSQEPLYKPKTGEFSKKFATFADKRSFGSILKDTYQTADVETKITSPDKGIEEKVSRKSFSDAKCYWRLS